MNGLFSRADLEIFANTLEIPIMLVCPEKEEQWVYPFLICFESDRDKLINLVPPTLAVETVPNRIEYTQQALIEYVNKLEYDKEM